MATLLMLMGIVGAGSDLDFDWVDDFDHVDQWTAQPSWLTHPSPTASVSTDGQVACFRINEPGRGMKWLAPMPDVWLEERPYLVVRYRAEHLATESNDYLIYVDDDIAARQLNAIRLCDVKSDGRWHVAAVDLTTLTDAESVDALAVQVQANIRGRAALWLDRVMLTDAVPDGAEVIHRKPLTPPIPDWTLSLPDVQWEAQPDWLGNPAVNCEQATDRHREITAFRVDESDRGMKWSCSVGEEISLVGHRYVTVRYRATGTRPTGDYAVCVWEDERRATGLSGSRTSH